MPGLPALGELGYAVNASITSSARKLHVPPVLDFHSSANQSRYLASSPFEEASVLSDDSFQIFEMGIFDDSRFHPDT